MASNPRSDILHRHEFIHTAVPPDPSSVHRKRACLECAKARERCSKGLPCARCSSKSLQCAYPDAKTGGLAATSVCSKGITTIRSPAYPDSTSSEQGEQVVHDALTSGSSSAIETISYGYPESRQISDGHQRRISTPLPVANVSEAENTPLLTVGQAHCRRTMSCQLPRTMGNLHLTPELSTMPLQQYAHSPITDSPVSWPASMDTFNTGYNPSESISTPMSEPSATFSSIVFDNQLPTTTTAMYTTLRSSEPPAWNTEYWMGQNSLSVQSQPTATFTYPIPFQDISEGGNTSMVPILPVVATSSPTETWSGYAEQSYARHGAIPGPCTTTTPEKGSFWVPQLQNLSPDDVESMSRRWSMAGLPYVTTV
jgi:hypothetical protein